MKGNESGGLEAPERPDALIVTDKPPSNPIEGFSVRYTPTGQPPRKHTFDATQRGDYLRVAYEWTGCRWREAGYERCDDVELEFGEQIPPELATAVLSELFDAAFESGTMTDVDVLNAIARDAYGSEITSEAVEQVEFGGDD